MIIEQKHHIQSDSDEDVKLLRNQKVLNDNTSLPDAKLYINSKIEKHLKQLEIIIEKQMQKWRSIKEKRDQESELHLEIKNNEKLLSKYSHQIFSFFFKRNVL